MLFVCSYNDTVAKQNPEPKKQRFAKSERVVCNVGSEWAAGAVQSLEEEDPQSGRVVPYKVKLDPPIGRMIAVPVDSNATVRPEICFGQVSDGLEFTIYCLPQIKSKPKRFQVNDRVVCIVEDSVLDYADEAFDSTGIVWAPGTVTEVEVSMEDAAGILLLELIDRPRQKWPKGVPSAPYRVQLDEGGASVLVHKDEHWLIRSEELSGGGTRLQRMEVVQHEDGWRKVDHNTGRFRPCDPPESAIQADFSAAW